MNEIPIIILSGLTSVKVALEFGFKVTCFDKSPHYGGLWQYTNDGRTVTNEADDDSFTPSVMRTTILNTSKELSAFSDFPPNPKLPNFMKHTLYMDYISSYAKQFNVLSNLKLSHEVLKCKPVVIDKNDINSCCSSNNQNENVACTDTLDDAKDRLAKDEDDTVLVRWELDILNKKTGEISKESFDRLIVATGHHNTPFVGHFPGQDKFKGLMLHSAYIKDILTDERFVDKNVLVIGIGNSACDAANDLALVANKCFLSCHRGNWFLTRSMPGTDAGLYDFALKTRWKHWLSKRLPTSIIDWKIIRDAERATNHKLLGLTPKHKPSEQVPAVNDLFPYRVFTGGVTLKSSVTHFTESGVVFDDESDVERPIDCVIKATGYQARMPFLDVDQLGLKSKERADEYELYLNIFAPNLTIDGDHNNNRFSDEDDVVTRKAINSLAFIGLVQPSGSISVISEMQARLACSVFSGVCQLPSKRKMLKCNQGIRARRSQAIRSHSRDQLLDDWIGYQDQLAKLLGVKPPMGKLLFKDFSLWKRLMFGPSVAYQYRLFGSGAWPEARQTIMRVPERVYEGINEGQNRAIFQTRLKSLADKRR